MLVKPRLKPKAPQPSHLGWLKDTGTPKVAASGHKIEVWSLGPKNDPKILSAWARHFRQHYCSDADLPSMLAGKGKTPTEYFRTEVFPDAKEKPGPSLRAGDFGEILVADYIEYILKYWCPRALRYQDRWNRNDPTKGCDVIGFKFAGSKPSGPNDELILFEVKSGFSKSKKNRLQDAIKGSTIDHLREAMTLNAIKQRLLTRGDKAAVARVQRFQNEAARPFRRLNGAAAIFDDLVFQSIDLTKSDASSRLGRRLSRPTPSRNDLATEASEVWFEHSVVDRLHGGWLC